MVGESIYCVVPLTFLDKLLYGLYNEPLRLGVRERRENCKNQTTLLKTQWYITQTKEKSIKNINMLLKPIIFMHSSLLTF